MQTANYHSVIKLQSCCCNAERYMKCTTGETLKPGLNQLCKNAMGHLTTNGVYPALQVCVSASQLEESLQTG